MPTPASQPEPQAFGSPVPTNRVRPCLSFGSSSIDAVLLCSNPADTYCHFVESARASFVRQTPPLAFAIQRVHWPPLALALPPQFGSIATCAMRPLKSGVPAL